LQAETERGFLLPVRRTEGLAAIQAAAKGFQFLCRLRPIHAGGPVGWQSNRAGRKDLAKRIDAGRDSVGQASPAPLLCAFAEPRSQGVAFDVA